MFNRVAITGHAGGIGQAFYQYFAPMAEVRGFDITNGYHIYHDRDRILTETLDCDLFINCACTDTTTAQAELAKQWSVLHKDHAHYIVQLGSILTNVAVTAPEELKVHRETKMLLHQTHVDINNAGLVCKSIMVAPGVVETDRVRNFDEYVTSKYLELKATDSLLYAQDVVNVTLANLGMITDRYFTSYIEVYNRNFKV